MNSDMDMDDWEIEMKNLLEMLERESTKSLRKINQRFVALGCPFDERFRQYFLKQSNIRLDLSFDTILFKQYGESSKQAAPNSNGPNDGHKMASNTNNKSSLATDNVDSPNPPRDGSFLEMKLENNIKAPIEIVDSDDESRSEKQSEVPAADKMGPNQTETNTLEQLSSGNENLDIEDVDTESNKQNDTEIDVKREVKAETEHEIEVEDLPLVEFDPVKENEKDSVGSDSIDDGSLGNQSQMSSLSNAQKQKKQSVASKNLKCKICSYATRDKSNFNKHLKIHDANAAKPFKCGNCDYACRVKIDLYRHQRVHADQKLIGVARDPKNGLYKCTHCTRNFTCFQALYLHLTKSHKTNRRLYNCVHCLRAFTQKTEKDRHEMQCQNRSFECHLCKNYVTGHVGDMQRHMRTHSGAKQFQCAICNKYFQRKCNLKRHLNSMHIHSHV